MKNWYTIPHLKSPSFIIWTHERTVSGVMNGSLSTVTDVVEWGMGILSALVGRMLNRSIR